MTNTAGPPEMLILVTGGTGKTGRRLVARLESAGIPVRLGSRSAAVPFDWEDRTTWEAALAGVSAVYLSYFPDLALPGAAETVAAFASLAVEKGADRLVLLSGRGEAGAERAEKLVRATGARVTILRASWFFQNFSEAFLVDAIRDGQVALPVGAVREPLIDADDIADAAFVVLTQDGHEGQLYELTGPHLMTFPEAIAEIGAAAGRSIRFTEIGIDDFVTGLQAQQVPEPFVDLLRELFTEVLDSRNESLTNGVQLVLGRPPRSFSSYVADVVATGVWNAPDAAAIS